METLGKITVVFISTIISALITGVVLLKLWAWFVTPIFGIDLISLIEAIGLMLLWSYLKAKYEKPQTSDFWTQFAERMGFVISYSAITLLLAWLVHLLM